MVSAAEAAVVMRIVLTSATARMRRTRNEPLSCWSEMTSEHEKEERSLVGGAHIGNPYAPDMEIGSSFTAH